MFKFITNLILSILVALMLIRTIVFSIPLDLFTQEVAMVIWFIWAVEGAIEAYYEEL